MILPSSLSAFSSILLLVPFLASGGQNGKPGTANDKPLAEFEKRIHSYVTLQRKLVSELPKLPHKAEPNQIAEHTQALAKAIQAARQSARQGDIFTPDAAEPIRQAVRSETKGLKGKEARREILETSAKKSSEAAPPAPVNLKVNASYPTGVSLSTVPPEILAKLPHLDKELEYRFVGPHLILFSPASSLIIDILPDALSAPSNKK
jgi:hypothetical protein